MEPQRHVEQFEIVERHVTEGRRPLTGAASREPVNSFGFDEQLVQTSGGGARLVQSHGAGLAGPAPARLDSSSLLMHDRSLEQRQAELASFAYPYSSSPLPQAHNSPREPPASILKSTPHFSSEENSLARKDSYRRMQEGQADNLSFAPSSQATMISRDSSRRAGRGAAGWWAELLEQVRGAERTPALVCGLLLLLLFLLLLVLLLVLFLRSAFAPYAVSSFLLYPPRCEECLRRNPALSAYRAPSQLFVHLSSPSQVDFELVGNPPFKSNSFTAVDFQSGFVAYADHALTNEHGRHTTCFLMELDRKALPAQDVLMDALASTRHEVHTEFGWQEYWQFVTEPVDANQAMSHFQRNVRDCEGAQWYLLKHTVHPRDESCYDCYDFCLPDFAVQRTHKYEDDYTLGVRRLNCFRHYVPEWSRLTVRPDEQGGHWGYPRRPQDTQRDEHGQWLNWAPVAVVGQPSQRRRRMIS